MTAAVKSDLDFCGTVQGGNFFTSFDGNLSYVHLRRLGLVGRPAFTAT